MNDDKENEEVLLDTSFRTGEELNWFRRTFSKMNKDSLRGSIFIMLLTGLGTGLFTLHHLFNQVGILFAVVLIVAIGGCLWLTADMLRHALMRTPNCHSMGDLNMHALGLVPHVLYNVLTFIYIMISLVINMSSISRIIYANFETLIWFIIHVDKEKQNFENFNRFFAYIVGFLLFFMVGQREIENLRYFTLYSFFIFVFVVFVFVIQSPLYIADLASRGEAHYNFVDISFYGLLSNFGCLVFAYNAIVNFYTVVSLVNNPTSRRLKKIFSRTFGILCGTFVVIGLVAYLCLGTERSQTVDLSILRPSIMDNDLLMIVARSLLIISLATSSGVNAHPLKAMLLQMMGLGNNFKINLIMSVAIMVVCTLVASLFANITNMVAVAGSCCATFIIFTFPSLIGLKTNYCNNWKSKALLIAFMVGMTALGVASSYVSLKEFLYNN